jgi:hypothetical protein
MLARELGVGKASHWASTDVNELVADIHDTIASATQTAARSAKNQKTKGPISSLMGVPSTSQASMPSLGARSHRDTAAIATVNSCLE